MPGPLRGMFCLTRGAALFPLALLFATASLYGADQNSHNSTGELAAAAGIPSVESVEIDMLLSCWEHQSAVAGPELLGVHLIRCDATFGTEKHSVGQIAIVSTEEAWFDLAPAEIPLGARSNRSHPDGTGFRLELPAHDLVLWTPKHVILANPPTKTWQWLSRATLPKGTSGNWWNRLLSGVRRPLSDWNPVLVEVSAARLRDRYQIEVVRRIDDRQIQLRFSPRDKAGASPLKPAIDVILDTCSCQVNAVRFSWENDDSTVLVITSRQSGIECCSKSRLEQLRAAGYHAISSKRFETK